LDPCFHRRFVPPRTKFVGKACLTAYKDGTKLAYFRGRKLQGKVVKLPEDYRGIVVERVPEQDPKTAVEEPVEDLDAEQEQIGSMQVTAEFDEMVVWGHEAVADASADPYVRSMEEWLQVADKVCMHPYSKGRISDTNSTNRFIPTRPLKTLRRNDAINND
jgi:ribonuclease H2 subunit C